MNELAIPSRTCHTWYMAINSFLHAGETVKIKYFAGQETDTESPVLIGTEFGVVVGPSATNGIVIVRPHNSDDEVRVHIKNLTKAI